MYFVELGVKGLVYGCMYAMMAVGLTLVYGLLRILHIAHAGVFALGAALARAGQLVEPALNVTRLMQVEPH